MPSPQLTRGPFTRTIALQPGVARESALVGLAILALARSSTALSAEHGAAAPPAALSPPSVMDSYAVARVNDEPVFSSKEFRPRAPSVSESMDRPGTGTNISADPDLIRNTTVWERLSEYRSRNRVQLLTLWESGASTVSLQAGRKGTPSLQWTSRLMNHGGATRGLLDRLFAVSVAGASSGLRGGTRNTTTTQTPAMPMRMEAAPK